MTHTQPGTRAAPLTQPRALGDGDRIAEIPFYGAYFWEGVSAKENVKML